MKIYIDADGCPVVNQTVKIAEKYRIESKHLLPYSNMQVTVLNQRSMQSQALHHQQYTMQQYQQV